MTFDTVNCPTFNAVHLSPKEGVRVDVDGADMLNIIGECFIRRPVLLVEGQGTVHENDENRQKPLHFDLKKG